jgi:LuxR family transcriptional regulator, maltose regulon positive regulatory protein
MGDEMLTTPPTTERPAVPRVGLLDHLEATSGTPVAAIIAPPGYGKTTVLTQWAERDPRPFGWLTIDQRHNDPAVLLRSMAVALQLVDAVAHPPLSALGSTGPSVLGTLLPQLGAALSASPRPAVLVLDDVHLLQNWDSREAVASLIEYLPPGSQFAIAGRGEPPLPLARLRAEGRVVELGAGDLAMDGQEAGSLLEGTRSTSPRSTSPS